MNKTTKFPSKQQAEPPVSGTSTSPFYAQAVALHLEGKRHEAITELEGALSQKGRLKSEQLAEIYAALGYIQFELEEFEDAAEAYTHLLECR